jgi:hypothetical protein
MKSTPTEAVVSYAAIKIREMPGDEAAARKINGWWDYEQSLIEVAENLCPQVKAEILLHEILHACCTYGNVGLEDDDEERVVNGIAPVLLGFLIHNPEIVEWLQNQTFMERN